MTDARRLLAFGLGDIAIGLLVWAVFDAALVGIALVVAGIAVLGVGLVKRSREQDPREALHDERAKQQRRDGRTDAAVDNIEHRPPPPPGA